MWTRWTTLLHCAVPPGLMPARFPSTQPFLAAVKRDAKECITFIPSERSVRQLLTRGLR